MWNAETTDFSTRIAVFSKPDDLHELAEVLVQEFGFHPTDAMHEAHSVPCVLAPRLTSANAERIAAIIERLGMRAEPVALVELDAFEDLRVVHHVACRLTGLEILDLRGCPAELIPWDDIEVLSFGETPADVSHHHQLTGVLTMNYSARGGRTPVDDFPIRTLELWIVCRNPQRVYRLDSSKLNFEMLAERKTNSMQINLRLLLERIACHAPQANLTPAAREFLDHDKLTRFASQEQLLNVTQLHLLIAHRLALGSK